jgi:hypothetical protein
VPENVPVGPWGFGRPRDVDTTKAVRSLTGSGGWSGDVTGASGLVRRTGNGLLVEVQCGHLAVFKRDVEVARAPYYAVVLSRLSVGMSIGMSVARRNSDSKR